MKGFLIGLSVIGLAAPLAAQDHAHHQMTTEAQAQDATERQLNEVRRGIERYRDIEIAKREGWKPFGGDEPLMGQHWSPPEKLDLDYQGPDAELDFARPNNLMYTEIDGQMVLTGAAFVVRLGPGEPVPEGFDGTSDNWHVHDFKAAWDAATEERPLLGWIGNWWLDNNWMVDGPEGRARGAMLHVWAALPNPDGPFADHNRVIPLLKLGIDPEYAQSLSLDAARGLDLATRNGCENAYGGKLWIADADRRDKRAILSICEEQAAALRKALKGHESHPEHVYGEAADAYRAVEAAVAERLTDRQRRRIAMMTEHGNHDEGHGEPHDRHEGQRQHDQ